MKVQANYEQTPNPIHSDLYIIEYKQKKNNLKTPPKKWNITKEQSSKPSPSKETVVEEINHRKNINRLIDLLKINSQPKQEDNSACSKIFRLIQKIQKRYWKICQLHYKIASFEAIRQYHSTFSEPQISTPSPQVPLMNSIQMNDFQIRKGSRNFEFNELIQIVNFNQGAKEDCKLKNSLSREFGIKNDQNIQKGVEGTRDNFNIFILRRNNSKEQISTRPELVTPISSDQFLPTQTRIAKSISPTSVDKSLPKPISLQDKQIEPRNRFENDAKERSLHELSIDSLRVDKCQQVNYKQEFQEVSKLQLPSFGMIGEKPKRTNRLMNNKERKVIFHYKNSNEKIANHIQSEYLLPSNVVTLVNKNESKPDLGVRSQRISSLQVIIGRNLPNQNINSPKIQLEAKADILEGKKYSSLPKITFTYQNPHSNNNLNQNLPQGKQQPNPFQQKAANQRRKQSQYILYNRPKKINPVTTKPVVRNLAVQNNYHIPINKFVVPNKKTCVQKPPTPTPSNFQPIQTSQPPSFHSKPQQAKRDDYYGDGLKVKQDVEARRERIRSTYVLVKTSHNASIKNIISASLQRYRTQSCNNMMNPACREPTVIQIK